MDQSSTSQEFVQVFGGLFPGLSKARGGLRGVCIKEPLTQRNYARHLDGQESLGVYPLREDGRCKWGAVDIDEGDDPASAIRVLEALVDLGLHPGCYLARSRAKGWHDIVLFSDWVSARDVRRLVARPGQRRSREHVQRCHEAAEQEPACGRRIVVPGAGQS